MGGMQKTAITFRSASTNTARSHQNEHEHVRDALQAIVRENDRAQIVRLTANHVDGQRDFDQQQIRDNHAEHDRGPHKDGQRSVAIAVR